MQGEFTPGKKHRNFLFVTYDKIWKFGIIAIGGPKLEGMQNIELTSQLASRHNHLGELD